MSTTEIDAGSNDLKVSIPPTPGSFYNMQQEYKFTETPTPTPSERGPSKIFAFKKSSPEETKKIWPQPKLRAASSMLSLDIPKNDQQPITNKLSQSSFYLNKLDADAEAIDAKRKKWYKIFLPPGKMSKKKILEEQIDNNEQQRDKRPWYKMKKNKEKNKKKIAIANS